jgi:hypothetical protein
MRLLICKVCRRTFQTLQRSYTPKYCSKPCYWEAMKTPDTINYERFKIIQENINHLFSNALPLLGILLVLFAVVAFVIMH